ncbi:hypothetical protein ACF0H5_004510 [Mactra antiquata]
MATITSTNVQSISNFNREQGRLELAKVLEWPLFHEEKIMQQSIHLDYLYDSWTFAVEKGFPWCKVAYIVTFADKLISQIKDCERITDILGFFNNNAVDLLDNLGEREYKIYSTYIFQTILPHFKLYQLVFTTPRDEQTPIVNVKVNPPFEANTLKQTKPLKVWEYEKKIEEMEEKEHTRVNERFAAKEQKLSSLETENKIVLDKAMEIDKQLDKDVVSNIIEEVMKQMTLSATETIKLDVQTLQEDLEFKLEKTSLPRPQVLGPPPRYSTQPGKVLSGKAPTSPKLSSRASQRGKKK